MENCVFIDIFTTHNDLFGHNNCPIQFCAEFFSNPEIFDNEKFFKFLPDRRKIFNIIPDEEILPSGYLNSGYKSSDVLTSDYNGVKLEEGLETIYKLLNNLKDKKFYIIGYNHINYDLDILNKNFKRVLNLEPIEFSSEYLIDVMKLAEYKIPVDVIGNYTMDSVLVYLLNDYQKVQNLHLIKSTVTDIKLTKIIFQKLIKENQSFSDVVKEMNSPRDINIVNFGKYKGAKISYIFENDLQYCNWLIKNKDMNKSHPNVINTIKKLFNTTIE